MNAPLHPLERLPATCRLVLLALAVLATGCATSKSITTETGQQGYHIACSVGGRGECLEKAGEICGSAGYDVLDRAKPRDVLFGDLQMTIACK